MRNRWLITITCFRRQIWVLKVDDGYEDTGGKIRYINTTCSGCCDRNCPGCCHCFSSGRRCSACDFDHEWYVGVDLNSHHLQCSLSRRVPWLFRTRLLRMELYLCTLCIMILTTTEAYPVLLQIGLVYRFDIRFETRHRNSLWWWQLYNFANLFLQTVAFSHVFTQRHIAVLRYRRSSVQLDTWVLCCDFQYRGKLILFLISYYLGDTLLKISIPLWETGNLSVPYAMPLTHTLRLCCRWWEIWFRRLG